MKIVIATDSFKGSMTSIEASEHIEAGINRVFSDCNIIKIPVADGGEGTVDSILNSYGGEYYSLVVTDPLLTPVNAVYGILNDGTALIEMASASGLPLVPESARDPLRATTKGTGEMILSAMNRKCRRIIVGLGGSATTDGGVGMAQALGYSFLDSSGKELTSGGGSLNKLSYIDTANVDHRLKDTEIIIASDVINPLFGKNGAAYVFSPQKGADSATVKRLDENLRHFDSIVKGYCDIQIASEPGTGAAGGLGYGLMAFCSATMKSGINMILDTIDFDSRIENADLIITGEGKIDGQSIFGKVPTGIAERAKKKNIPVLVIAGGIGDDINQVYEYGISSIMSTVNKAMPLSDAISQAPELLSDATERAMRIMQIGMNL